MRLTLFLILFIITLSSIYALPCDNCLIDDGSPGGIPGCDGICTFSAENNNFCEDCNKFACSGDGICDAALGETYDNCPTDCPIPCTPACSIPDFQCPDGSRIQECQLVSGCEDWNPIDCNSNSQCELECGSGTYCASSGLCESECGNGMCGANENCPADVGSCIDSICYEPACTSGCGQTPVPNGQTDEACLSPNYCDGSGNCVAPPQCSVAGDCGLSTNICLSFDCVGGSCVTIPDDGVVCDDGSQCTNPDVCSGGICAGSAINCNDNNPCTIDSCDAFLGCQYSDESQGTSCGAGMECDGAGTCISSCIPSTEVCDDSVDNDCDGFTDCSDSDCDDDNADVNPDAAEACNLLI